jgi:uncharacterized membrane protein
MAVLIALFASWLIFRGIGTLGVSALSTWHDSARYALALMFLFTSTAHFNKMKHDLARMVPARLPEPLLIIYVTGVLEILGGIGLMLPRFHALAALCLIVLLVAMFPGNVKADRQHLKLRGREATALWLRAPMQILFIVLLWWAAH